MGPHPANWPKLFWKKVEKTKTCWIWKGNLNQYGSPTIDVAEPTRKYWYLPNCRNPRVIAKFLNEALVGGLIHLKPTCKNILCVNPKHMAEGGLTKKQKMDIVRRWNLSEKHKTTKAKLGKEYFVSSERIRQIIKKYGVAPMPKTCEKHLFIDRNSEGREFCSKCGIQIFVTWIDEKKAGCMAHSEEEAKTFFDILKRDNDAKED